jgi:hypothetical protein
MTQALRSQTARTRMCRLVSDFTEEIKWKMERCCVVPMWVQRPCLPASLRIFKAA